MKRRPRRHEAAKFNLLPFLEVLLCVMGALIVLLIVISKRTHDKTTEVAAATKDDRERLQAERDELSWRIELVHQSRDATAAQLAEQRAGLSHIEDHARRLRDQYRELERAAYDLQQSLAAPSEASRELDDQLAAIQMRMREIAEQLEAKKLAPQPTAGYAIIPYEGPNGTQRRPMYIECCDDGIILQPEGVVLTADDFMGPLGPGNPLAASMRAAREYMQRNRPADGSAPGEPYPLLLIRPDGIEAYYVAREALTSWGSEFGYEFVDQEWKLEYPPADPNLLAITKAAAEDARQRQRMLAKAAPKAFREPEGDGTYFRASPSTGGVVVDGGGGRRGGGGRKSAGARGGGAAGDGDSFAEHGRRDDDNAPRGKGGFKRSGGGAGSGSFAPAGEGSPGQSGEGSPDLQLAARNQPGQQGQHGGEPGEALKPGQYMPKPPQSMASKRGKDWGIRDAGPKAVPISRKIRVRCQADGLTILSDDRAASNQQAVAFGPRTEDSVEEFVSRVWDHMDRWGIAGNNMYWKPQLLFEVTPDSRPRYEEIKALLEGSGLDVVEKGQASTAQGAQGKRK